METKLARRKILNETGEGLKKQTEHEKGGGDGGGGGVGGERERRASVRD